MQNSRMTSTLAVWAAASCCLVACAGAAIADDLPAIKLSAGNKVPACVTPGRLQAYLKGRNPTLDPRFDTIAADYMRHGQALGVRWDYAFFQMIMETGQLSFRNGNRAGDVKPSQNNFAGLGATGGVPGESFPDISTGVRAHLEHVLLYAGEKLEAPVAERTRKVQEWGVLTDWHKTIKHPITYAELASKWAPKSRGYIDSFEQIADKFFADQCQKPDPNPELLAAARGDAPSTRQQTAVPQPVLEVPPLATAEQPFEKVSGAELARRALTEEQAVRSGLGVGGVPRVKIINTPETESAAPGGSTAEPSAPPSVKSAADQKPAATRTAAVGALPKSAAPAPDVMPAPQAPAATAAPAGKCRVWTASYGGQRAVIVKSVLDQVANFTVLDVNEGQETREAEAFIAAYAKGGSIAGEFVNQNEALEKAFELCPKG